METRLRDNDKNERVICIDTDDTLIMWPSDPHIPGTERVEIVDPYDHSTLYLTPHKQHIRLLKHFYNRGYYVIVWSAGGGLWAERVVQTLGLDNYVNEIMAKPTKFIDDLPPHEWMGHNLWVEDKSTNGTI